MTVNRRATVTHRREPMLGSVLDCRVVARSRRRARRAIRAVTDEIECWEHRLSAYRVDSELRCWIDGRVGDTDLSPELCSVLARAKHWELTTDRRLDPILRLDGSVAAFEVDPAGRVRSTGDLGGLRLDAFAKGFVVDRAAERAAALPGVIDVMVGVGGDVRAIGPIGVTVGVEHPGRPFDNEPPIDVVAVRNEGFAVSGRSRRGDHLVDGRTGRTIVFDGSFAVRSATLEAADAWATSLCVDPDFIPGCDIEWSRVSIDGEVTSTSDPEPRMASTARRPLA